MSFRVFFLPGLPSNFANRDQKHCSHWNNLPACLCSPGLLLAKQVRSLLFTTQGSKLVTHSGQLAIYKTSLPYWSHYLPFFSKIKDGLSFQLQVNQRPFWLYFAHHLPGRRALGVSWLYSRCDKIPKINSFQLGVVYLGSWVQSFGPWLCSPIAWDLWQSHASGGSA